MNLDINYKNNPLHGISLKNMLTEIVDHYGFGILFAYLNINCFKSNPSIDSSVKFLKKTDWAREKVEAFYLYQFKSLPRASTEQFELPPRERVIPQDQIPGKPAELSMEDAERLREKRAKKTAARNQNTGYRSGSGKNFSSQQGSGNSNNYGNGDARRNDRELSTSSNDSDPWAKWRK
jgi:uncharacterized protein (DUF2132 family)